MTSNDHTIDSPPQFAGWYRYINLAGLYAAQNKCWLKRKCCHIDEICVILYRFVIDQAIATTHSISARFQEIFKRVTDISEKEHIWSSMNGVPVDDAGDKWFPYWYLILQKQLTMTSTDHTGFVNNRMPLFSLRPTTVTCMIRHLIRLWSQQVNMNGNNRLGPVILFRCVKQTMKTLQSRHKFFIVYMKVWLKKA